MANITNSFGYTGADGSWTVPPGITQVTVVSTGAPGASETGVTGSGGAPGSINVTFNVTHGQVITYGVGGNTIIGDTGKTYGGGGNGKNPGGGCTWLKLNGQLIVVAAGGGGAGQGIPTAYSGGFQKPGFGGFGGGIGLYLGDANAGYAGTPGSTSGEVISSPGSAGVTSFTPPDSGPYVGLTVGPGNGGTTTSGANGSAGASMLGGDGGTTSVGSGFHNSGGGGGAGYYGGGGGAETYSHSSNAPGSGGGGGSNFIADAINGVAPNIFTNGQGATAGIKFTYQNAAPTVTVSSPSGGTYIPKTAGIYNFIWNFVDPGDLQASYQVVIRQNGVDTSLFDSTTVDSASGILPVDISSFPTDVLINWSVTVADSAGNVAVSPLGYFYVGSGPDFTVLPANGSTVATGAPTISWEDYTIEAGATLAQWAVQITRATTGVVVASAVSSSSNASQASWTPPESILLSGESYSVAVTLTDSQGMSVTKTVTLSATYDSPDVIKSWVDLSGLNTDGAVVVNWDGSHADTNFLSWRIYRKTDTTDWSLVATVASQGVTSYSDILIKSKVTYYYAVTQVALATAGLVESPLGYTRDDSDDVVSANIATVPDIANYWILDTVDPSGRVQLFNVTSAPLTEAYDSTTYTIIGRGARTEYGTRIGYNGTIDAQLRGTDGTPGIIRALLVGIRALQHTYYLRTPFGDLLKVSLGDIEYDPVAGVGTAEMYDISFTWQEVS